MAVKILVFLTEFVNSLRLVKKGWPLIIFTVLLDLLFLFFYGAIKSFFFSRIYEYLLTGGALVIEKSAEISESAMPSFAQVFSQPEVKTYLSSALWLGVALILSIYVVFVLLQGASWRISHIIAGKRASFNQYARQFFFLNIFWFFIFIVYEVVSLIMDYGALLAQRFYNVEPSKGIFSMIFILVLLHFTFISYCLIGRFNVLKIIKKSFSVGIKKLYQLIPAYLVILIVYLLLDRLVLPTVNLIHPYVFIIVGIILVLPAYTWARVYLNLVVNDIAGK